MLHPKRNENSPELKQQDGEIIQTLEISAYLSTAVKAISGSCILTWMIMTIRSRNLMWNFLIRMIVRA